MIKNMISNKQNNSLKKNMVTYGIVIVFYIVMMILQGTDSLPNLIQGALVPLCIYVILAVSLNLTVGILGELSLGHAGFMCIGAFTSAFFSMYFIDVIPNNLVRLLIGIIIAVIITAFFGAVIGVPVLRLNGDYLAIVTLAFGEIIKNLVNVLYIGKDANGLHFSIKDSASLNLLEDGKLIINGAQGITGIPKTATFTIGIIAVILTLFIVLNLINSRTGRAIMAIRDNRIAAESIGIPITKYKLLAFTISASLAGMAGALYANNLATLSATQKNFGYNMSIMILVFVVLGGIGNIRGSIISAVVLYLIPELLRELGDFRMLIYSLVLIIMMIFSWSPKAIEFRKKYSLKRFLESKKSKREDA